MRKLLLLRSIVIVAVLLSSCNKKSDPEPETERVEKLLTASSWQVQNVLVDGTDQTSVYTGLTIAFTSSGYTSKNGGGIWPSTDSWNFTDDSATSLKRGDGTTVTIIDLTDTQLIVELSWSTDSFTAGRLNSLKGKHKFVFKH